MTAVCGPPDWVLRASRTVRSQSPGQISSKCRQNHRCIPSQLCGLSRRPSSSGALPEKPDGARRSVARPSVVPAVRARHCVCVMSVVSGNLAEDPTGCCSALLIFHGGPVTHSDLAGREPWPLWCHRG